MRVTWCTDIHLNFCKGMERRAFYDALQASEGEYIFITGDISEQSTIRKHLLEIREHVSKDIYYVAGNHDFWNIEGYKRFHCTSLYTDPSEVHVKSDIRATRGILSYLNREVEGMHYVSLRPPMELTEGVWVVGQDGWYDMQHGRVTFSSGYMRDWDYISDFRKDYYISCPKFAQAEVRRLKAKIKAALKNKVRTLAILTHVPPFTRNSLYMDRPSPVETVCFYTSKYMGDMLLDMARLHPGVDFRVFCGHSHNEASYMPLSNLWCQTGGAMYGHPEHSIEVVEL